MISKKACVWTIAASDSGGGAGVERDNRVISDFGCHACSVITALTAQNSLKICDIEETRDDFFKSNLYHLKDDLKADAIKIGLVPSIDSLNTITSFLNSYGNDRPYTVYDPVMIASVGDHMSSLVTDDLFNSGFLKNVDLITPNIPELAKLTKCNNLAKNLDEIIIQVRILQKSFAGNVLVTGGHNQISGYVYDVLFLDQDAPIVFRSKYFDHDNKHGTGCAISSAIASLIAQNYFVQDAVTAGIMYVSKAIAQGYSLGHGAGTVDSRFDYDDIEFLPEIISSFDDAPKQCKFAETEKKLGLYPVVPSVEWVERLLKNGVKTIQLRIKDSNYPNLENDIEKVVSLGQKYEARVFIDDYWQLAIKHKAYGVHLGQEDILTADLDAIASSGIRLGLSTHGYFEIAKAVQLNPSYIALGHIFPTKTKVMKSHPQGLVCLNHYAQLLKKYSTVAIGGIKENSMPLVKNTGVGSIAVVTAITEADDPDLATKKLMELVK